MSAMSETEALAELSRNPWSALRFSREGQLIELRSLPAKPTPELVMKLTDQRSALRFVPRGAYSLADVRKWVAEALEAFELAEQGRLRPGANPQP